MKTIDITTKGKLFQHSMRPSQSLHSRLAKNKTIESNFSKRSIDQLTMCIIFRKKKIQFTVKTKTSFQELEKSLYSQFYSHLLKEYEHQPQKAAKILKFIVGFESADGDINFDYRMTLKKGVVQKTKFFYPLVRNAPGCMPYKIYNCLAIGGFSKVYLTRSLEDGQFYVIKFMKKSLGEDSHDRDKFDSIRNQVNVCNDLDHPFLVKMVQAFETKNFYCLVFEYCPGGELFFLLKRVKVMSQSMARFYFLQILYGMQYLHSKNIIYRDLKPENILIDADGNCKIVDFGLSKRIDSRTKTYSYCGSAEYMAPEMILRTGHSFGVDYYSLGAFLYQLVTGLPPFYTKNHQQLQQSIICQQLSFPPHVELSNQIKDLLDKLLKKDQKYRLGSYIGVKQILFHPWVGKVNAASILSKQVKSPYQPDLKEYNFDNSQLGDDEEEFTSLVKGDCSEENCILQEYIPSKAKSSQLTEFISEIMAKITIQQKENRPQFRSDSSLDVRKDRSKDRVLDVYKSPRINRANRLEKIDQRCSKEKTNESSESRKMKNILRLSPYLNVKQVSPKKQKQLMSFIETKILKAEKGGRTLKRTKIQHNRIQAQ